MTPAKTSKAAQTAAQTTTAQTTTAQTTGSQTAAPSPAWRQLLRPPSKHDLLQLIRWIFLVAALMNGVAVIVGLGMNFRQTPDWLGAAALAGMILMLRQWTLDYLAARPSSTAWIFGEAAVLLLLGLSKGSLPITLGVFYLGLYYRSLYDQPKVMALRAGVYLAVHLFSAYLLIAWRGAVIAPFSYLAQVIGFPQTAIIVYILSVALQKMTSDERRLTRITTHMLDLVSEIDASGRFTYVSPSHQGVLGYREGDMLGQPVKNFMHPEDLGLFGEVVERLVVYRRPVQVEARLRTAAGAYLWLECLINPLVSAGGVFDRAVIGAHDVTARKRIELDLRASEERFQQLAGAIDDAFWLLDLEQMKMVYLSPAVEKLTGCTVEQFYLQPDLWRTLIHPADQARLQEAELQQQISGAPLDLELRLVRADGEIRWIWTRAEFVLDETGRPYRLAAIHKDITTRKLITDQLETSLAEKETLLREIHHRVKNNLQVVSSLLSLQARQVTQSNATSILQDSQNRVRSMALIHEKLYQSSDLALIDFGGYLHSLCAALSRTYTGATQRVAFQVEAEVIGLELDQAMPCGLIVNELVANALKHAFPQERSGKIGVTLSRHGAQVRLEVFDTGVGLPSGLALLSSASLGMQLVQTLVAQIDGQLAVQSAPEAGTHFCIDFPHESMKGSG